jgi:hypothetical protein
VTVEELARSMRRPVEVAREMLAEDERRGIVVCRDGRWYLTSEAERKFGLALRSLSEGVAA